MVDMPNPERARLTRADVLGSYPDREEFQVDRTLVWVMIPENGSRQNWLEQADLSFHDIWRVVPDVLRFAQEISRALLPEFWHTHDSVGTADQVLAVWGIWIHPDTHLTLFHVGPDHPFMWDHPDLPKFPEDEPVMIEREADGKLKEQKQDTS